MIDEHGIGQKEYRQLCGALIGTKLEAMIFELRGTGVTHREFFHILEASGLLAYRLALKQNDGTVPLDREWTPSHVIRMNHWKDLLVAKPGKNGKLEQIALEKLLQARVNNVMAAIGPKDTNVLPAEREAATKQIKDILQAALGPEGASE